MCLFFPAPADLGRWQRKRSVALMHSEAYTLTSTCNHWASTWSDPHCRSVLLARWLPFSVGLINLDNILCDCFESMFDLIALLLSTSMWPLWRWPDRAFYLHRHLSHDIQFLYREIDLKEALSFPMSLPSHWNAHAPVEEVGSITPTCCW